MSCLALTSRLLNIQTVKSKTLQRITIHLHSATIRDPIEEVAQGWQDLDHLLVRFWTSRSVRLRLVYEGGNYLRDHAPSLLPELTKRGLVDLVEHIPPPSLRTTMRR